MIGETDDSGPWTDKSYPLFSEQRRKPTAFEIEASTSSLKPGYHYKSLYSKKVDLFVGEYQCLFGSEIRNEKYEYKPADRAETCAEIYSMYIACKATGIGDDDYWAQFDARHRPAPPPNSVLTIDAPSVPELFAVDAGADEIHCGDIASDDIRQQFQ